MSRTGQLLDQICALARSLRTETANESLRPLVEQHQEFRRLTAAQDPALHDPIEIEHVRFSQQQVGGST